MYVGTLSVRPRPFFPYAISTNCWNTFCFIVSFPPSFVRIPFATSTNCTSSFTCRTNSNPSNGNSRFTFACCSGALGASGSPVVAESAHVSGPAACAAEVCALSPSVGPSPSSDPAPDTGNVPFARLGCPCALPRRVGPPCTTIFPNHGPCSERIRNVEVPIRSAFAITSSAPHAPTRTAHLRTNALSLSPASRTSAPPTSLQRTRRRVSGRRQTPPPPFADTESKPVAVPRWDKMHNTFSFELRQLAYPEPLRRPTARFDSLELKHRVM
jgi:hypothetical protein